MTIKYLVFAICLFCSITMLSQANSLGIQEKESIIRIEVNPEHLYSNAVERRATSISLPYGKLGYSDFIITPDQMLVDDFAKANPTIKTFKIQSTTNKSVNGRLVLTPEYSYGTILTPNGLASFYPQDGIYYLEEGVHFKPEQKEICTHFKEEGRIGHFNKKMKSVDRRINFSNGGTRRNYSLAITCTGEFYELNGNSFNAVNTVIAATVSGLNVIYENELSVRLVIAQSALFMNSATDPFIPDEMGGEGRTIQASRAINDLFNINSYDIGHVFHRTQPDDGWSSGGVAYLGSACDDGFQDGGPVKAGGWSGSFNNNGNGFIALAAHEFGHMFGAEHTFNGIGESCTEAIGETSAYEIGSGTTIMSYNGICDDEQNISSGGEADNYFHVHSLFQMTSYIDAFGDCSSNVPLSNSAPEVAANPCGTEIRIPKQTPFKLSGSATDEEGDEMTFAWEQYDEDGPDTPTQGFIDAQAGSSAIAPLFRSFPPSVDTSRYFPALFTLLEGATTDKFEVLPTVPRTMNFQFTARDNNLVGGSIASDEVQVIVEDNGPLIIQEIPEIEAGVPFTVSWTLNGTEDMCEMADILLSTSGGPNFRTILAEDVDYASGSVEIVLPASFPATPTGRIMIACADSECYSFFDITNGICNVTSDCSAGGSVICDTEFEEFEQGDPGLNLNLQHFDGDFISSLAIEIDEIIPTLAPVAIFDQDGGCNEFFQYYTNKTILAVDKTGNYTFNVDVSASGGTGIISIYDLSSYNIDNPCASFVGANATAVNDMGFTLQTSLTIPLEECKEYLLIATNNTPTTNMPINTEVTNIFGPGNVVEIEQTPSAEYSNTFIAVNESGVIEVVSPTSDFTSLSGGLYDIYTVTYKSSGPTPPALVDPSTWVGNMLTDVQTMDCIRLSSNKKQVLIDFSCRINSLELGVQTPCDPASNTFSQEIIITYEEPPLSGNITVNGVPFPITGSPQTVNLVGLQSDGAVNGVSAAFSEIPDCSIFVAELFTAPENCCPITLDLGGDRVVCDTEIVILDAGPDGETYNWFKDGEDLMISDQMLTVTETGNYLVEVFSATGCSKFDVVNVTINPSPTVELEDDLSVCEGEFYSLQSNTNASELVWYKDDVEIEGEVNPSLLISEPGTYVLVGTNTFNCTEMDTVVVEYVTRPVVDLGEDQQFCQGDPAFTLDAGMDGTIYTWFLNSAIIPDETGMTLDVNESGLYSVIVDKGGGCDARDTVDIEFFPLAQVVAGNDINVCQGSSEELLSFINAESYEWFFNGVLFSDQSEAPTVTEGGEYVVVGLNEIGCESSDTVIVTEVVPPDIDLGDDKVGCIGSEVVLSVDSVGLILWLQDGNPLSQNASVAVTEPGEYIVNIIAATECSGRDTINVTFEPGPSLELGDDDSFCAGDSYTIEANTDGDNITWFLDGTEIMGENGFELTVTEGGEYQAVVTGTGDCEVEDFITIVANEVPDLVLGEDEVICDGESVTLITDFGANAYDWQFNGMTISTDPSVDVSEAGTYTLVVTNEFGCTDSDDIEVFANERPTLEIEESYSICEGESVDIVAMSNGTSFQWFIDGVEQMGVTGNTITIGVDATVEVIASSSEGCTSTEMTEVISVASPEVNLGDDFSLCPNESFVLNAGDHSSYLWSNGQVTPTITVLSINPEVGGVDTYSVTVTNEAGCSAIDEVMVEIFPIIQGEITASASGVCNGEPVDLIASGGANYEWVDPNGTLLEIDGAMAVALPTETTTYQVIITDDCPNNIDPVNITIDVFEAGVEVDAGEDDCVVLGNTLELNATGGAFFEWEEDATIVSGANTANPIVSPSEETQYFVNITDENGCVFRDSVTICILDDPLENFKLVTIITPNGDGQNDELVFEGLEAFPENSLTIYNRWGYPVFEKKRYQADGDLWNGENGGDILPAATYYYILTFDGNTYKSNITIMR